MRPSSEVLVVAVKLLVGAYARWEGCKPDNAQRLYFANHTSHIDTLALWSALPIRLRGHTHPVAARDYWGKGFRHYIATKALGAVLIDRVRTAQVQEPVQGRAQGLVKGLAQGLVDPLAPLVDLLERGQSLILFPEGTRGTQAMPAAFKSGLYRLAAQFPHVELIPVYLENLHRAMPKGAAFPVPMTCTVRFGAPLPRYVAESKEAFLARARDAVIHLAGDIAP